MSDPIDRNALMDALKTIQGCLQTTQIDCIVNNDIHLCDSCKHYYPSCLSGKDDVVFGDSVGHDNICACNKYQPRYDEEWRKMHYESSKSQGFLEGVKMCEQAQPERKAETRKGYWVKHNTGHSVYYDCSLCGCAAPCTETADKFLWKLSNYCPDCGSEMRNA